MIRAKIIRYLGSIKGKIFIFALLATLIPALGLGGLFYEQNSSLLQQKAEEEMRGVASYASRELDLWLKERLYDLRVFSSSYILSENLESLMTRPTDSSAGNRLSKVEASRNLQDYLKLVKTQFSNYSRLMAFNLDGSVIGKSPLSEGKIQLPSDWREQIADNNMIVGDGIWDENLEQIVLTVAVPISSNQGQQVGVLAADINLELATHLIDGFPLSKSGEIYLMRPNGDLILSSRLSPLDLQQHNQGSAVTNRLFGQSSELYEYDSYLGERVVGILSKVPQLNWGLVVEKASDEVFADIIELRNITLLLVTILLLIIGMGAFFMGHSIVRPLRRLINGAEEVAAGNLEVELPVAYHDELGFATEVFNDMVVRLHQNHEELERLSITDGLTGLYNHKHLVETLARQIDRYNRNRSTFSILMIDLDHFKNVNDNYGHLAGDAVLRRVGAIFLENIRTIDYAGRYGGEEFLIILEDTPEEEARQLGERIREHVGSEVFEVDVKNIEVTISVGVACVGGDKDQPDNLIARADEALYRAKNKGRNRVEVAKVIASITSIQDKAR